MTDGIFVLIIFMHPCHYFFKLLQEHFHSLPCSYPYHRLRHHHHLHSTTTPPPQHHLPSTAPLKQSSAPKDT
ncbi:hypothetical protein E2C01_061052 [Portunus trituberculatus]|uniref:Uncharacterized protein n=1 Tax=Portunus trituberculatus TaxID=210409 RepID=A0A5B7HC71_PORTR|nr:hypothetical protein [Portunus trituberculatus]